MIRGTISESMFAKKFEMKELGSLKYFLRIEVAHSRQGIFISQQKCQGSPQTNRRDSITSKYSNRPEA